MKQLLLISLFSLISLSVFSQAEGKIMLSNDGSKLIVKPWDSIPKMSFYKIHQNLDIYTVAPDTAQLGFYKYNPIFKKSIANNYLGNYGSPYQSMLWFDRDREVDFLFMQPYRAYAILFDDLKFVNTRTPYTTLGYNAGGPKPNKEEELRILHSRNVTPDFNISLMLNLLYGRGFYNNMETKHTNSILYSNLIRPRYHLYAAVGQNHLRNIESGGIKDVEDITNPSSNIRNYEDILQTFVGGATSRLYNEFIDIKQKYNIGFERELALKDSVAQWFVPVTSIVHHFHFSNSLKWYEEKSRNPYDVYPKTPLFETSQTNDRVSLQKATNNLGIYFNEGVNRFTPFGLGTYIQHESYRYNNNPWHKISSAMDTLGYDSVKIVRPSIAFSHGVDSFIRDYNPYSFQNVMVGGTLFKRMGQSFFYDLVGESYFLGRRAGDTKLKGNIELRILKLDSVAFSGSAEIANTTPDFLLTRYYSNNFWWENSGFNRTNTQRFSGNFNWENIKTSATFRLENIKDYIYLDTIGLPRQHSGNIQIIALDLKKDIKAGPFHWDNEVTFQATSDSSIIPLPKISAYSTIYFQFVYSKVLNTQLGVDCRYNTAYYAPRYMPATGQFFLQKDMLIGNYPMVSVYGNFLVKRMRIFLNYTHVNMGMKPSNYFGSPGYALNPRFFKLGILWSFYD